jgi:hypothetical protein
LDKFLNDANFANILHPHYMGIGGSFQHRTKQEWTGTGYRKGVIDSEGGMIPAGKTVELGQITDGTSNTICIAEESTWVVKTSDNSQLDAGSDNSLGFLQGGEFVGNKSRDNNIRSFGINFVRFPINSKMDTSIYNSDGQAWMNAPIRSAHTGGAQVGHVDGSVHFMSNTAVLDVLCNLADRDDGKVVATP